MSYEIEIKPLKVEVREKSFWLKYPERYNKPVFELPFTWTCPNDEHVNEDSFSENNAIYAIRQRALLGGTVWITRPCEKCGASVTILLDVHPKIGGTDDKKAVVKEE